MRWWLVLAWFLPFIGGCSDDAREPLTQARPNRGGASGTGGSSTGGDDGMGGEPASGTGGTAGTAGTAGSAGTGVPSGDVFLSGTIADGISGAQALALVSQPNVAILGFPSDFNGLSVRILDGNFVYQTFSDVRIVRFSPDARTSQPYSAGTYPQMPEANDLELPTSPCTSSGDNRVVSFLTGPEGRLVYQCERGYYENGELVDSGGYTLFAIGHDRLALVAGLGILDLADGTIVSSPLRGLLAARATEDGFHAVDGYNVLWELTLDGDVNELGAYPDPPDGLSVLEQSARLGPNDALYAICTPDLYSEVVVRRTVDGDNEVIYTEDDNPLVKTEPFGSTLITSP